MNNKRRKLEYIRTKNNIRLGGKITSCFCVSEVLNNREKCILEYGELELERISKKYKLPLKLISFASGYVGDGFIQRVETFKIYMKLKN